MNRVGFEVKRSKVNVTTRLNTFQKWGICINSWLSNSVFCFFRCFVAVLLGLWLFSVSSKTVWHQIGLWWHFCWYRLLSYISSITIELFCVTFPRTVDPAHVCSESVQCWKWRMCTWLHLYTHHSLLPVSAGLQVAWWWDTVRGYGTYCWW